jgi:quinol monooxygenase YgiN
MAYALVVQFTANEGEEARVQELMAELAAESSKEEGVLYYAAHRDPENPRVFLMYEAYKDEDAFKAHGDTEHFKRIGPGELFGITERRREVYETV